ncbi:MAG: hypothetical protein RIT27_1310 [Pseudomonadota bacterium]|jgi:hypothetical protein
MISKCCENLKWLDKQNCATSACVSATEKNKTFEIKTENRKNYCRIKIDDCVIKSEQKKCDYLFVETQKECFIFVELKGGEIGIACEQICQTIDYFISKSIQIKYKKAYVISSSVYPKSDVAFGKYKEKLKQKYGILLERYTRHYIANENDLFK